MKISGQIEQIFAQAVALDQSGGLRNTIYADSKEVYILNYDHTVLMRFRLRSHESPFETPISFKANDYDSNEFIEDDGKIIFINNVGGFERRKSCGKAEYSTDEVKKLFNQFLTERDKTADEITLNKSILALLDSDLSHIEFSGKKGETMKMIQRNIYSGGIIEIQEKEEGNLFVNELKRDFGPVGIKTNDFASMFAFQETLKFTFPTEREDYIIVRSMFKDKRDMVGIIACCIYDEIIKIREVQNGRKEPKVRRSK